MGTGKLPPAVGNCWSSLSLEIGVPQGEYKWEHAGINVSDRTKRLGFAIDR